MRGVVIRRLGVPAIAGLLLASAIPSAGIVAAAGQEVFDSMFCMQRTPASACYNGGAQTLTADLAGPLSWVELPMSRADFTTEALVIEIRQGAPDGALLATSDPVPAAAIPIGTIEGSPDTWSWIHFTFPAPVTVAVGDPLAIVVPTVPVSTSADPAWGWGKDGPVYANGGAYGGVGPTYSPPDGSWQAWWDGSDFAFRTAVTDIAAPPMPELSLKIAPTASSVPKAGSITINGTMACPAEPVSVELTVSASQAVGKRAVVTGSASTSASCDDTATWSAVVAPTAGMLKPGWVSVRVTAAFSDQYGQTGATEATGLVLIRG